MSLKYTPQSLSKCAHSKVLPATHAAPIHNRERSAVTEPLLLRAARGEGLKILAVECERTPVWLMRQAGRYMADFRKFSDKIGFRERSETADIAVELSLQPWKAFGTDGVIMFSDILTPLPALGIEFDVIKGKGPIIEKPIRSIEQIRELLPLNDVQQQVPFVGEILRTLRAETAGKSTLLGFIGAPWTLAAYAIEGKADRHCMVTKQMMLRAPSMLHELLRHLADQLVEYASYQIDSGAQVLQLFESWAHHLSPAQFEEFGKPYADEVIRGLKARYPDTPIIYHANGGTGKLSQIGGMSGDVIGLDWHTDVREARSLLGESAVLQGNVDPMILFAPEHKIRQAVQQCISEAGQHHILNVGHGVAQGTPEENVALFCQVARETLASQPLHREQQLVGV